MKKSAVLFNVLGVFLFPFLLVLAFTSVSSLATLYYEFLPSWLDFAIKFFYDLASYTLDLAVFFALGAFCYALAQKNILSAVLVAVLGIINAGVLPIIQFFVRSLFFASSTEAYIMQEYWTNDVITSMTELLKFGIGALICIATWLFFKLSKRGGQIFPSLCKTEWGGFRKCAYNKRGADTFESYNICDRRRIWRTEYNISYIEYCFQCSRIFCSRFWGIYGKTFILPEKRLTKQIYYNKIIENIFFRESVLNYSYFRKETKNEKNSCSYACRYNGGNVVCLRRRQRQNNRGNKSSC